MIYGQDKDCLISFYIIFIFDLKIMVKVNVYILFKGFFWDKYEIVQVNREYMVYI